MLPNPFQQVHDDPDLTPEGADEVKTTTCYMCACRCGIRVHLKDGSIRYIDGNPDHPVNKGVLCAKGSAGIMQHESPARLTKPLLRVGKRGEGRFREIEWDEALTVAAEWLGMVRRTDPKRLAFFTGRDQSQSFTGWWAAQFGTPNYAAHGGFCSVNMAAGGLYTLGGAFWEFGEPDWDRTRYLMMFGVAEDHDSNPIKMGLGRLKTRGDAKFIAVNPVRTGYGAIADEWIGIRPGTDGLFVLALCQELLRAERVDFDFLARFTNAPYLVVQDPGAADDGLIARDEQGAPLVWDQATGRRAAAGEAKISPALVGERALADGRRAVPAFQLLVERILDPKYAPDAVAERTGIPAETIRRIAAELADAAFSDDAVLDQPWTDASGRRHAGVPIRPVSFHAMRGISAHSNGFHTCRSLHILQMLLGAVDRPGSWLYEPPFPRPIPPGPKPTGKAVAAGKPLGGMPLGNPTGPDDLLIDAHGKPLRLDKAYSWEAPIASHGLMHMLLHNAWAADPYPIEVVFMYMANMAWNSAMNVSGTLKYLTDTDPKTGQYRIPKVIYSDAYYSETVAYADLVLPDTTYLERWDCLSLLDRPISNSHGPADGIRQPVLTADRDVRPFQDVLLDLGARLALPGFVTDDSHAKYPGGYADYLVNHERAPGIGPLAGWRGDGTQHGRGAVNPDQLARYIENGCFWHEPLAEDARYMRFANRSYLDYAHRMGWIPDANPIVLHLYSEPLQRFRLSARGHGAVQPPAEHKARIETYFDPLPFWYAPFGDENVELTFPLHAITQRPMHMYHSWGSQNAWLRQITAANRLYIHPETARRFVIEDDDWIWIESPEGRIKAQVRVAEGTNPDTLWTWNAIGKRAGTWGLAPDAPEATRGFLLNHLIADLLPAREGGMRYANADPVTGQAAWYDLRVTIRKCTPAELAAVNPQHDVLPAPVGQKKSPDILRYGKALKGQPSGRPPVAAKDWLGNRNGVASTVPGIRPGHGNRTEREETEPQPRPPKDEC